jgi:hypothetical protein
VLTTDARFVEDHMLISESSAFAVSASENWLMMVRFQELRRLAGNIIKEVIRHADY